MKRRHEEGGNDNEKSDEDYEEREEEEEEEDDDEEEEEEEEEERKVSGRRGKKREKTKPPARKRVTVKEEQNKIISELQKLISNLDRSQADASHNEGDPNGSEKDKGDEGVKNPLKTWEALQNRAIEAKVGPASILNFEKSISHMQQASNTDGARIIRINVGGQLFVTTKATLCKCKNSLLYDIATNTADPKSMIKDSNGDYFFDRSPDFFDRILDYLRSGSIDIPSNKNDRKILLSEAEFYRITPLVTSLRGIFIPSVLGLDFDCTRALTEWCHAKSFKLIYRGSEDGFRAADFHRCCDGHAPTLFIVKSELGFIFGGYTEIKWDSNDTNKLFEGSKNEFIFSLVNPQGTDPLIFPVRKHSTFKCILHQKNYGPSLGSNQGGFCEIHVSDNPNVNPNSHVLGFPSMFDGKGYTNKIFNGTERFKLIDYEVFEVTKEGSSQQTNN